MPDEVVPQRVVVLPEFEWHPYMAWHKDVDFDAIRKQNINRVTSQMLDIIANLRASSNGDAKLDDQTLAGIFAHLLQLATEDACQEGVEMAGKKSGAHLQMLAFNRRFQLFRARGG